MKKNIFTSLLFLFCIFIQANSAQTLAPIDLSLLNGKAKTLAQPAYPETAKKSGISGAVKLSVPVDKQGNVTKAEAVSGEMLLRDLSHVSARASKFEPYLVKGKVVKFKGFLVFNFVASNSGSASLTDSESKASQAPTKEETKVFEEYLKESKTDFWGEFNQQDDKTKNSKSESPTVAKSQSENPCSINLSDPFYVYNSKNKFEPVTMERVKEIVKICDEAIKTVSPDPTSFYIRGLARYYLIRGFEKPLIKTLTETETVSSEDIHLSLEDFQKFIQNQIALNNKRNDGLATEEFKMSYLASGELMAVSAVKEEKTELFQSALEQFKLGEKLKTLSAHYDSGINSVISGDRDIINQILAEVAKTTNTTPNADEVKMRYQKYAADYSAKEAIYKQNVQNFQAVLKSQQTASTPDNNQVCQSLSSMNRAFQAAKDSFSLIIEMKNKGEITDANLKSQIDSRAAQQTVVQGQINAAAAKYGCKLK